VTRSPRSAPRVRQASPPGADARSGAETAKGEEAGPVLIALEPGGLFSALFAATKAGDARAEAARRTAAVILRNVARAPTRPARA
jgi:hypothetical protein